MQIDFCTSHIETLTKLFEIAKKHNGTINFGTAHFRNELSVSDLKEFTPIDDDVLRAFESLENEIVDGEIKESCEEIWFSLVQKNGGKPICHRMSYLIKEVTINLQSDYESNIYWNYERISENGIFASRDEEYKRSTAERLTEWIESHISDYSDLILFGDAPTIIDGFGNGGIVKDYRVYRSGMALKFFADLVTEYLNEEPIQNIY